MRLLLDEHLSPRIADALVAAGVDTVAVARRPDLLGHDDATLLAVATAEGCALVTRDVVDFTRLARELAADGRSHGGIVLVPSRARGAADIRALVRALRTLRKRVSSESLADSIRWLELRD